MKYSNGRKGGLPRLGACQVSLDARKRLVQGRRPELIHDAVAPAAFSCIRCDSTKILQLTQVPGHGLIASTHIAANVPGRPASWILRKEPQDLNPQRVDSKDVDHA